MTARFPVLLFAVFIFSQPSVPSLAQDLQDKVTVSGTATTKVTPDTMNWSLQVKNKEPNLERAAETHSAAVKAVLDFLNAQELPETDIQTSGMQFGQNWSYEGREKVKDGYFASTDISFQLDNLDKYTKLWIGLSRLPHVALTGVYYDHSQRIEIRNTTRRKALLAAREKAEDLAETLGSKIGRPLLIEEASESYGLRTSNFTMSNNITSAGGVPGENADLAPGQIPITMRIRASFLLLKD